MLFPLGLMCGGFLISPFSSIVAPKAHPALRRAALDPWCLGVSAVVLVVVGLFYSPWPTMVRFASQGLGPWLPTIFLGLTILRLMRAPPSDRRAERRFWSNITTALAFWWLGVTWRNVAAGLVDPSSLAGVLITDCLYVVYYVAWIVAAERRPHRDDPWRLWDLERKWVAATAALAVVAMLSYFVLLPSWHGADQVRSKIPSYLLYTVLDVYLAGRFLFISRASKSPRWKALHGAIAVSLTLIALADMLFIASAVSGLAATSSLRWVPLLPFVALIFTAALREQAFPPHTRPAAMAAPAVVGLTPPVVTLLWALLFPIAHIVTHALGLTDPSLRPQRVDIVLAATVILGAVALGQQRHLERRARLQEQMRRDTEAALRSSEDDLRLILEKRYADGALRDEREKFDQAFHLSPDGLAIGRAAGEVLDVNPGLVELLGRSRGELLGATMSDLLGWLGLDAKTDESRPVPGLEARFVDAHGRERVAVATLEPIEHRDQRLVLLVARNETPKNDAGIAAHAFDHAELALVAVDADAHVRLWNRAASRLLPFSPDQPVSPDMAVSSEQAVSSDQVLGRPLDEVLPADVLDRALRDGRAVWLDLEGEDIEGSPSGEGAPERRLLLLRPAASDASPGDDRLGSDR